LADRPTALCGECSNWTFEQTKAVVAGPEPAASRKTCIHKKRRQKNHKNNRELRKSRVVSGLWSLVFGLCNES